MFLYPQIKSSSHSGKDELVDKGPIDNVFFQVWRGIDVTCPVTSSAPLFSHEDEPSARRSVGAWPMYPSEISADHCVVPINTPKAPRCEPRK